MNHRSLARPSLVLAVLTLIACDKVGGGDATKGAATASQSVTSASADDGCNAFVEKMKATSKSKKDSPEEAKIAADICKVVSPQARTCVKTASDDDAIKKCLESEKEKISEVVFAGMKAKDAADAQRGKAITIAKLGLKGVLPGETEDPIIGTGSPVSITGATFAANVAEAEASDPKTLKDGENDAKLFNPKNVQKETLADGWALTYQNNGSAGDTYFTTVRRNIGGKGYLCESAQSTPKQQKSVLAFCKSLAK